MSKKWYEAGSAYKKSAEIFSTQLSSKHEAATSLVDAANCFKKVDVDAATDCFQQVCVKISSFKLKTVISFWLSSIALRFNYLFINFSKVMV